MEQKSHFAYYHNKSYNFLISAMFLAGGLCVEFGVTDELSPLVWLFYILAAISLCRGILWLMSPPVISGDKESISLKPNLRTKPITYPWRKLMSIRYDIKQKSIGNGRRVLEKKLYFTFAGGQVVCIDHDMLTVSFNDLHKHLSKLAPEVKWIYPD